MILLLLVLPSALMIFENGRSTSILYPMFTTTIDVAIFLTDRLNIFCHMKIESSSSLGFFWYALTL